MTTPAILFTQRMKAGLSFFRNMLAAELSSSHHNADPLNTPSTSTNALAWKSAPALNPPNSAINEKIVIGLLNVLSQRRSSDFAQE